MRKTLCLLLAVLLALGTTIQAFAVEAYSSDEFLSDSPVEYDLEAGRQDLIKLPEDGTYVEGELMVKLSNAMSLQSEEDALSEYIEKADLLFSFDSPDDEFSLSSSTEMSGTWYRVTLKENLDMLEAMRGIEASENVLYVEPNYIRTADVSTEEIFDSDPYIHVQEWLDRINAPDVWQGGENAGGGILVAVVDSGVDLDHPDLAGNLYTTGRDFIQDDYVADDENGHGTHVAGIIAAINNSIGTRGVAYLARILPVRVLARDGSGSEHEISAGIKYAADNGANIINLSLGGIGYGKVEAEAVAYARSKGCLVVAAAGNNNIPTTESDGGLYGNVFCSPADIPGVLTVMAADVDGTLASFSNYDSDPAAGAEYEIMAPGVNILSTTMGGGYGYMQGTSMACPMVAGAAAILMGMGCSADSAFQIISSCSKVSAGRVNYSYPSLDIKACVDKAKASLSYNTTPNLINAKVTAGLDTLNFGHHDVDFSALNTTGRVYFYNNAFKSSLSLSFENIGGSGNVSITGTVGGRPVSTVNCSVVPGESGKQYALSFSGAPAVNSDGCIDIVLNCNGKAIYRDSIEAFELKTMPTSFFTYTDYRGQWYANLEQSVTLAGSSGIGTVWVADAEIIVNPGKSLTIECQSGNKQVVVYSGKDKWFYTNSDNSSGSGKLIFNRVALLGLTGFGASYYTEETNSIEIYGCTVYNPMIYNVSYAAQNFYCDNGLAFCSLSGNAFYISGFCDLYWLNITCNYFWGNNVNNCISSKIQANDSMFDNTFADDYGYDAYTALKCYVRNYSSNVGFYNNCVLGPIFVYSLDGNGNRTESYAKVYHVYHQSVGTQNEHGGALFDDMEDKVYCASSSTVTESVSTMKSWGLNRCCPAFVTEMSVLDYSFSDSNPCAINYTIRFDFSVPVILPEWASLGSDTDPMAGNASLRLSADGTYCVVSGEMTYNSNGRTDFYELSDFYVYSITQGGKQYYMWATAMGRQRFYNVPVRFDDYFYYPDLDYFFVGGDDDIRYIAWYDERITTAYSADIYRSINDGEAVKIASGISETHYDDNESLPANTKICYSVELSGDDVNTLSGSKEFVIELSDYDMGVNLSVGEFVSSGIGTFSASLRGYQVIDDCMEFVLPERAVAVSFSDAVKNMGIAYGAIYDSDGTHIFIGGGDYSVIDMNEALFTLTVNTTAGTKTIRASNGGLSEWENMDSVTYTQVSGIGWIAEDADGEAAQILNSSGANIFSAEYDANGKMTSVKKIKTSGGVYKPVSGSARAFFTGTGLAPVCSPVVK